ncbi:MULTISPECIES: sensor histidine kinase [unclassified Mesorhizobium]|uniref:sensor histidine kinase n=1 Tax=unclassified Mesorhizobium TaxID=325217 RepID=UPI0015E31BAA|nr:MULTISPECIES: HAMP domain-containing sensor histidine kinase [unclassified Mesorhizobium]
MAAIVGMVAALVIAGIAIAIILERFVIGQIDQRLDAQIAALSSALTRDGTGRLAVGPALSGPPFDRAGSGWTWQIVGQGGRLASPSMRDNVPIPPPKPTGPLHQLSGLSEWLGAIRSFGRPRPADGPTAGGEYLHWRILDVPFGNGTLTIAATAPYTAIYAPLREALFPLAAALAVLGILLVGAMLAQVRLGLRPLARLRADLADVRAGTRTTVPKDQPIEVIPLVEEVNSLLTENAEGLARARRHVANLAHGLKTPLASLSLGLESSMEEGSASMRAQLELMERLIRHHLARARVAALAGPARTSTNVSERLGDITNMMATIYRDRHLSYEVQVLNDVAVAVEAQDFDEIFGNVLDNASKWAGSRVALGVSTDQRQVIIEIDDDGPGLDAAAIPEVLRPGKRIDEAAPGYGFGLPIASELTQLYGGDLVLLTAAKLGGLRVRISLPRRL